MVYPNLYSWSSCFLMASTIALSSNVFPLPLFYFECSRSWSFSIVGVEGEEPRPGPPHIPDIRIYNLRRGVWHCYNSRSRWETEWWDRTKLGVCSIDKFLICYNDETRPGTAQPGQGRVQLAKVLIGGNRCGNLFDKFWEVIWKNGVSWDWSEFRRTLIELLSRLHSPSYHILLAGVQSLSLQSKIHLRSVEEPENL